MANRARRWTSGLAALVLVAGLQAASLGPARADGWRGGHNWHGRSFGYHHRHYGHHHHDGAGVAVLVGGIVLGSLLVASLASPPRRVATPVAAAPIRLGNCKPTTGETIINGRRAQMRGTWCTDQYGRGYILDDSVRFDRYLD